MKDFFFKYYNRFIALIWVVLVFALWMQFVNRSPLLESFLFVLCSLILAFPVTTFVSRYLLPKALKTKRIKAFAVGLVVSIFLLALLLALNAEMFGWLEKQGVFGNSTMVSATLIPLHLRFFSLIPASIFVILGFCGIEFFREHHKISQENYRILQEHARLQQIHLEDQLQLLKDQINPHSMFNVLNHIHVLMQDDVDLASELLVKFSEILRYQLYDCNKQYVKLKDEIQYLKDVIEVEKMRWGGDLNVICSWNVTMGEKEINPLLLIPFVENAFKHVSRLPHENGYVNIQLEQNGNNLNFMVENSKSTEHTSKSNGSGLGLANVRKRLNILYPEKHKLDITETDTVYKTVLNISL